MATLKNDWIEKLKSGKEVYVTFKSDDQEDGLDGISGVLKSFHEDLLSFVLDIGEDDVHGFTFDEVVDVQLCDDVRTVAMGVAQPKSPGGRRVRLTTKGGTELDGSLMEMNTEELVIQIEDSSGRGQENFIKCPVESASKLEFLGD